MKSIVRKERISFHVSAKWIEPSTILVELLMKCVMRDIGEKKTTTPKEKKPLMNSILTMLRNISCLQSIFLECISAAYFRAELTHSIWEDQFYPNSNKNFFFLRAIHSTIKQYHLIKMHKTMKLSTCSFEKMHKYNSTKYKFMIENSEQNESAHHIITYSCAWTIFRVLTVQRSGSPIRWQMPKLSVSEVWISVP